MLEDTFITLSKYNKSYTPAASNEGRFVLTKNMTVIDYRVF